MYTKALVIVPTYNEAENIDALIEQFIKLPVHFHLLIIDDASPDGTAQVVQKKICQLAHLQRINMIQRPQKLGLGSAYIAGFHYALQKKYAYILQMDADFSHNPKDLIRLYNLCFKGSYDLVIGSRYINGVNVVNWPLSRILLSYLANFFVRFITGIPIKDVTAGFKCFRHTVLQTFDCNQLQCNGYDFQIETKFLAWKYGFGIKEIPIVFTDRVYGSSKMSKKIIWKAIKGVVKMIIRSFFRRYHR